MSDEQEQLRCSLWSLYIKTGFVCNANSPRGSSTRTLQLQYHQRFSVRIIVGLVPVLLIRDSDISANRP